MSEAPNRGTKNFAGDFYLLATIMLWGNTFASAKIVMTELSPSVFVSSRFLIACILLLLLLRWRGVLYLPRRRDLPMLILLGLLGISLNQYVWSAGLNLTTASKAAVLIATAPIFTNLFSIARHLIKGGSSDALPGPLAWFGILLSFGGVFLVLNNSLTAITLGGGSLLGDAAILFAAMLWAFYSVMATPYLKSMGALPVSAWTLFFGALGLLPIGLLNLGDVTSDAFTLPIIACFLFTAIGSAALGNLWWYEGISRLGVSRAAVYSYLIPVVAVVSANLLLGETFSLIQAFGAAIVLTGVAITRRFTPAG
ncbi:DMT family transporter [Ferrovibrio sp.]|uniref:DMT family transporter n=1 Tax=Ferrovibrio sp. TaxID=1917215 RepID=UPI0035B473D4